MRSLQTIGWPERFYGPHSTYINNVQKLLAELPNAFEAVSTHGQSIVGVCLPFHGGVCSPTLLYDCLVLLSHDYIYLSMSISYEAHARVSTEQEFSGFTMTIFVPAYKCLRFSRIQSEICFHGKDYSIVKLQEKVLQLPSTSNLR